MTVNRWLLTLMLFAVLIMTTGVAVGEPAPANEDCLDCHDSSHGDAYSTLDSSLVASIHVDLECVDCHASIAELPHEESLAPVNCGDCHDAEMEDYQWHGRLPTGNGGDIPTCANCHGKHSILPSSDKASQVHVLNLPHTCGTCHENLDLTRKHKTLHGEAVMAFKNSVHGRSTIGGVYSAATCSDCHSEAGTTHQILAPNNPKSSVYYANIPETCGKCHRGITLDFWDGIHGQLIKEGRVDVPVCTDCHGEHGIIYADDPRSPVSPERLAEATCDPCHESARLNEKYKVSDGTQRTYVDSYHGLKSKAGDLTVANCSSCHGSHRILPASDETSSINQHNLAETCGHCHEGITADIAQTPIHAEPGVSRTPMADVVKNVYILLIVLTIGGMVLHWVIDLRKEIKKVSQGPQVKRMTTGEVWQHHLLTVSFISLVISGFSLRYSDAFWVGWLFGWDGGFALRGIIHRVAAVVMTITAIWHAIYLTTARGKQFLKDMIPNIDDWHHLVQLNLYNLGIRKEKPKFGRFIYIEKVEYWALIWGTIVMAITGVLLWVDNLAVAWVPKGFLDVVLVIHFYEAWLASLAILVWHLYSTVFNPGVYPMNPAWYSGKVPLKLYEHEHPNDPGLPKLRQEALAEAAKSAPTKPGVSEETTEEESASH